MSTSPPRDSEAHAERTISPSPRQRKPLGEKSQSDTNGRLSTQSTAPSIRVVADNGPDAYTKSPFPTQPAHLLPPVASNYVPRIVRYYQDQVVSSERQRTNASSPKPSSSEALLPLPENALRPSGNRASTDTNVSSDAETLTSSTNYESSSQSPSLSSRFSQTITTPSTPTLPDELAASKLPELPQPTINLHRNNRSTIRLVIPSGSSDVPSWSESKSESTTSSLDSLQTITTKILPRPASPPAESEIHVSSPASSHRGGVDTDETDAQPQQSPSTKSKHAPPAPGTSSSDSIPYSEPSSSSVVKVILPQLTSNPPPSTSHAAPQSASSSDIKYPVVRRQTASGSWATVSTQQDSEPRMNEDDRMNDDARLSIWSSRLSTIPSESEPPSQPISPGPASPRYFGSPRLRRVLGSIASSDSGTGFSHSSLSATSIPYPAPLFSPQQRRLPTPPGRESEEREDTLGDLLSPPLQPKRSGYFAKHRGLSRPGSSDSINSQISFQGELSWVKRFYSGGDYPPLESPYSTPLHSSSRLNTATSGTTTSPLSEAFPAEIFRPRNRPRDRNGRELRNQPSTDTMRTEGSWTDRFRRPIWSSSGWGSGVFSPHLHPDRRANQDQNAWSMPSLDQPSRNVIGPVGRQVALFCLGFVFPFAWFCAALLPIPSKPNSLDPDAPVDEAALTRRDRNFLRTNPGALVSQEKVEKLYLKAHWWRSLNRIMCVVGLLIIGAIVALVIFAIRMRDGQR
ncbi:hypothetical protein BT63DRAFT_438114 [Microthyrium microscopicum]|uniref:Serine-rich protein n=1 Tax=Microthyrium microscopicum TaxID=703497 RepID=A0A6A6UJ82_9PEZI|nr:hypothetical protein BT63DRAFT_438114 [Microthyrium microscopicum]